MKHHRIWTNPPDGPGTWRELHRIKRNEYGDILLTLDGGEVWQFTPRNPAIDTPNLETIYTAGWMKIAWSRIGNVGTTSSIGCITFHGGGPALKGNFRILPPASVEADATKKARRKAGRENGKLGGRKPHPKIKEAILSVHENVKGQKANEPYKRPSIFLACENVINEMKLPFKVDNLRKQYRVWKVNRRRGKN